MPRNEGSVRVRTKNGGYDIVPKSVLGHYVANGYVVEVLTW